MSQEQNWARDRATTAAPNIGAIKAGMTVNDAVDRPIGNVIDVEGEILSVDGRPEGLGYFEVPTNYIHRIDEAVHLSRELRELSVGASVTGLHAPPADAAADWTPRSVLDSPDLSTESASVRDRAPEPKGHYGSSFTASHTPAGQGSNTPVGDEPDGYRAWEAELDRRSWMTYAAWLAPVAVGAASAGAYAYWRAQHAKRSRLQRIKAAVAAAGTSARPLLEVAVDRKSFGLLAPLAAISLAAYLRSTRDRGRLEEAKASLPSAHRLRDHLPSGSDLRDRLPSRKELRDRLPSRSDLSEHLPSFDGWKDHLSSLDGWQDRMPSLHDVRGRMPTVSRPDMPDVEMPPAWTMAIPIVGAGLLAAFMTARRRMRRHDGRHQRQIADIMTRGVRTIRPDATIHEAASLMKSLGVGSLPVCDGSRLQGMVTDRDLVIRGMADDRDHHTAPVSEVMSKDVEYAFDDEPIERAADLMRRHKIRRLPIVDRQRSLVGILSLGDLAVDTSDDRMSGETLEGISSPSRPRR